MDSQEVCGRATKVDVAVIVHGGKKREDTRQSTLKMIQQATSRWGTVEPEHMSGVNDGFFVTSVDSTRATIAEICFSRWIERVHRLDAERVCRY